MTTVDIILITAALTFLALLFAALIFYAMRRASRFIGSMVTILKGLTGAITQAAGVIHVTNGELGYMRQVTQAAQGQQAVEQVPQPPVGHAGTMPPAFPQRAWETYPDAKTEDTDHSLLTETDADVIAAQHREEMRGKGIDVDEDDLPQAAVVEEA